MMGLTLIRSYLLDDGKVLELWDQWPDVQVREYASVADARAGEPSGKVTIPGTMVETISDRLKRMVFGNDSVK